MPNRFSQAARDAANLTNKELGVEIAKLTKLSSQNLSDLLPAKRDKEAFIKLMTQVEADTAMDTKIANLVDNIRVVGPVIFKILKVLI
jgi:hypothetical protein